MLGETPNPGSPFRVGHPSATCWEGGQLMARSCPSPQEWPSAPRGPFPRDPWEAGSHSHTVRVTRSPGLPVRQAAWCNLHSRVPAGRQGIPCWPPRLHACSAPLSLLLGPPTRKHLLGILASGSASFERAAG